MKVGESIFRRENTFEALRAFMHLLQVKVTDASLRSELLHHPDYPSLLSVSDTLSSFRIENVAFKPSIDTFDQIDTPLLIRYVANDQKGPRLGILQPAEGGFISCYDTEKHRWDISSKQEFLQQYAVDTAILVDAENAIVEKKYQVTETKQRLHYVQRFVVLTLCAAPFLALTVLSLMGYRLSAIWLISHLLLSLLGCLVTTFLVGYEMDLYNPTLQSLCNIGQKLNCGAVLGSGASKIAGLSWSVIGFSYFSANMLLLLICNGEVQDKIAILSWVGLLSLPYIFFAVAYQWLAVRQWCPLCLIVQCILSLQFISIWKAGSDSMFKTMPGTAMILEACSLYLLTGAIGCLAIMALRSAKESSSHHIRLQRLKRDPRIFHAILEKQPSFSINPTGLGITIGAPDARYTITKICNPYCRHCADAHQPMVDLRELHPDVRLQIVFNATNHPADLSGAPVRHLLAIAATGDKRLVETALDDWYSSDKKDYPAFAAKYPVREDPAGQSDKIEQMSNWCTNNAIVATPTFFVNGRHLPDLYEVGDLKYFLSS